MNICHIQKGTEKKTIDELIGRQGKFLKFLNSKEKVTVYIRQ